MKFNKKLIIPVMLVGAAISLLLLESSNRSTQGQSRSRSAAEGPAAARDRASFRDLDRMGPRPPATEAQSEIKDDAGDAPSSLMPREDRSAERYRRSVAVAPEGAPIVPPGFALSAPEASVSVGGERLSPAVYDGVFERVGLEPGQPATIHFDWPTEHRIQLVSVQGVHGGTIEGAVGRVLPVSKGGAFSFTFTPSTQRGHDEVILTAANVSFTIPFWKAQEVSEVSSRWNTPWALPVAGTFAMPTRMGTAT